VTTLDGEGREPQAEIALIEVLVNGVASSVASSTTLEGLVQLIGVERRGVAIALDGQVIPRSAWPDSALVDGARVEIVTAAAGG
jgi:sulfur carrier protein